MIGERSWDRELLGSGLCSLRDIAERYHWDAQAAQSFYMHRANEPRADDAGSQSGNGGVG